MKNEIEKREAPKPLSEFEAFTGGKLTQVPHSKSANFVIFYNMAATNIQRMLAHCEKKTELDPLSKFKNDKPPVLSDHTYLVFSNYLWHAYKYEARNKDDYSVSDDDKQVINKLFAKLDDVRNYHAHIWHDNEALVFDAQLKAFVEEKYNRALAQASETNAEALIAYEQNKDNKRIKQFPLFKANNGKQYLTQEGRVFFLSFFLTSGQMSQLLQQRRGSKRTDEPLFKIKHMVYKFYCRRDGASIMGFSMEDSFLSAMDAEQRKNVLNARQAWKLLTYLQDYPEYLAGDEGIGLMYPDPETKQKIKKVTTVRELLAYLHERDLLQEFSFSPILYTLSEDEEDNSQEEYEKARTLALTHPDVPDYSFHIGFDALYKLVILCLKYGEADYAKKLKEVMTKLAKNRRTLYGILDANMYKMDDLSVFDLDYLTDRSHHNLRAYRMLTEKGIKLFESVMSGRKVTYKAVAAVAQRIRPRDEDEFEVIPEPIIIYPHDFIEKTEQKFRAGNRFVFYAAKYLIDNKVTPDWYWEVEQFTPEKVKMFQKEIDEGSGWRLCLENDHVTIAIPKNETEGNNITRAKNDGPQPMYQFSLGPRAMRYLLALHFLENKDVLKNKTANLNNFLAVALKQDFDKLTKNGWQAQNDFELLEERFIPAYLKQSVEMDMPTMTVRIKDRFRRMEEEWDKVRSNKPFMKRTEKNKVVMQCYQLYNWTVSNKTVKFLRKPEYNEMSVCHYSLGNKTKVKHLYNKLFKLNARSPRVPSEVEDMLFGADSLDELMENVIADRKKYIRQEIAMLNALPNNAAKKELAAKLFTLLGISLPEKLQSKADAAALAGKHKKTLDVLPFAIQPVMLLKYFGHPAYRDDYSTAKNISRSDNDLFATVRTCKHSARLHQPHYDITLLEKLQIASEDAEVTAAFALQQRKWVGLMNTTHTEDVLLWQVALKYLASNPYTLPFSQQLTAADGDLKLGNLHSAKITVPIPRKIERDEEKEEVKPDYIYAKIKMHQLDDAMFAQDRERLYNAALHYLRRHRAGDEKTFWDQLPEWMVEELKEKERKRKERALAGKTDDGETEYDYSVGTGQDDESAEKNNPIPYHVLRNEINLVAVHGKALAASLLDWERNVIATATQNMNDAEKQAFMYKNKAKGGLARLGFIEIINLTNLTADIVKEIKKYRNSTFHSKIPTKGTYTFITRPGSALGTLLGITEPLHWRRDNRKYIVEPNAGV